MTAHFEEKAVPATTTQVAAGVTCDRCKRHDPRAARAHADDVTRWGRLSDGSSRGEGDVTSYTIGDTAVILKTGSSYPEGGSSETWNYDLCPACVNDWLLPLIEAECDQKPEYTETEW